MTKCSRFLPCTLSGRLLGLFILAALALALILASSVSWAVRHHFENSIRPHLVQYLQYINTELGTPAQQANAQQLAQRLNMHIYFRSDNEQWSTTGETVDFSHFPTFKQFQSGDVSYRFGHHIDNEYVIARHPDYQLLFVMPRDTVDQYKILIVLLVLALLLGLYFAIRHLFAPIKKIEQSLKRIGSGELDHRLEVHRQDELGQLATGINHMTDDIEQMLEAKRQLLLAISHELRSPLTRAKLSAELIDDETRRTALHHDLNEMEQLISELLETERLATQHQALHLSECQPHLLLEQVIHEHFHDANLSLDLSANPLMQWDEARIKLLFKNLIDNAIKHGGHTSKPVAIRVWQQQNKLNISIKDHGPGIAEEHLPHLTQAFYRVDPARQRQTGGYGLGLYLCRVIVEAHQGQLSIQSAPDQGTEIRLAFPLTANDAT